MPHPSSPHATRMLRARRPRSGQRGNAPALGFTLIELLVVISIIALLISILLPTLASARRTARGIACATQLKQIALAAEIYRNDYDDFYVPIWMQLSPGVVGSELRWGALLKPYLNDNTAVGNRVDTEGVLYCPEVPGANRNRSASYVSYGYNRWGVGGDTVSGGVTGNGFPDVMLRELKSPPGQTLMMIDIERSTDPVRRGWFEAYPSTFFTYTRHNDAANAVFADSHVSTMVLDEILTDTAPATNEEPWYGDNTD